MIWHDGHIFLDAMMNIPKFATLAVVIEPHAPLAETVADALRMRGFDVLVATTHVGAAASVVDQSGVHFLAAAVPAPGENQDGAYLAHARAKNPGLAVVVMVSDLAEVTDGVPLDAVTILKPFDRAELESAISRAMRLR